MDSPSHSALVSLGTSESVHLLQALCQGATIAAAYDELDVLRWANSAFEVRFLRSAHQPIGFADLLRHAHARGFGIQIDCGDVEQFLRDVLPRRRSVPYRAFEVDLVDGEWLWMTETVLPSGWLVSIAHVITQLKHHEQTLRHARDQAMVAAQTDALTELANRRHVFQRGEQLLAECAAAAIPLSVCAIDIDHFKRANDQLGHAGGDEILRQFAAYCDGSVRTGDLLGRVGGEEFLCLLPATSAEAALQIVERLRSQLPPAFVPPKLDPFRYTFSAGVAAARPGESFPGLMRRADQALYAAKERGRDRTELAP